MARAVVPKGFRNNPNSGLCCSRINGMRPVPYSGQLALWLLGTATFRRLVLGAQQAAVRAKGAADYRRCVGVRAKVGRRCDHIMRPKSHTGRCVAVERYFLQRGLHMRPNVQARFITQYRRVSLPKSRAPAPLPSCLATLPASRRPALPCQTSCPGSAR